MHRTLVITWLAASLLLLGCGDGTEEASPDESAGSEALPEDDTPSEASSEASSGASTSEGDPTVVEPSAPDAPSGAVRARVSLQDATLDGRRPPEDYAELVRRTVEPPLREILACYEARLDETPGIEGDLRLRLWVSAREVIRVTVEQPLADEALQACAVERVYAIQIPDDVPRAGVRVRFLLRFALGPRTVEPPPGVLVTEVAAPGGEG